MDVIEMHVRILSDKEREILEDFIKSGNKQEGFRMLKVRIKRNYSRIAEDFQLIKRIMEKIK
jgi:hypothetical protein